MDMQPKTLQEAVIYFSNPANCLDYMLAWRWPNGVVTCPTCGSSKVKFLGNQGRWQCSSHHAKRQFSAKVGTIMEDSPISLDKWLVAMWLIVNCKNGISSCEIARALGVTQKTAWFMDHRIRLTMQDEYATGKLGGEVEADETFIRAKARNMHKSKRDRRITGTGGKDKTAVIGLLERGGKVRTKVISSRKKKELHAEVKKHVEAGAALYTDALMSYRGLETDFVHRVVDHAVEYVNGRIHTNGLENFWSLLKRGLKGTYVAVEPFHLDRYIDEQVFRYNNRATKENPLTDADRFSLALTQLANKRLTYAELTAKTAEGASGTPEPF